MDAVPVALVLCLVAAAGCAGDGAVLPMDTAPDASAGRDATVPDPVASPIPPMGSPAAPIAPAQPAAPVWDPCPTGWRSVTLEDDPSTCEPWPDGGAADCAAHEAHLPGTAECAPVGTACPEGALPEELPADATVRFVLEGADAASADGSRDRPFPTLATALAGAAPSTIIAVGVGTYDELVDLPAEVSLWGACPEATVIQSSRTASITGVVAIDTGTAHAIRNLRISTSERPGISVLNEGTSLVLEHVVIEEARGFGLVASAGRVTGAEVVIRHTRSAADGTWGYGLHSEAGAVVDLERILILTNRVFGATAILGSTLRLADAAVRGTRPRPDMAHGRGVQVQAGSTLELRRAVVEGSHEVGVFAGSTSTVRIEDSVIRDTVPAADTGILGSGLAVVADEAGGPSIEVRRTVFERNHEGAIEIVHRTPPVLLEDVVIRDTLPRPAGGLSGLGIAAADGGRFSARRLHVARNHRAGVLLNGSSTEGEIEDLVIRDTAADESEFPSGVGLALEEGGRVSLARGSIERSAIGGVWVQGGSELNAKDVTIHAVDRQSGVETSGRGMAIYTGASAVLRRVSIDSVDETGLGVMDDSIVDVEDLTVIGTGLDSDQGRGLEINRGSILDGRRIEIERATEMGVLVHSEGTEVTIDHLAVRETRPASNGWFGRALGVEQGAHAVVRTAHFQANHDVGVNTSNRGSSLTLSDARVIDTRPRSADQTLGRGVNVQLGAHLSLVRVEVVRSHEIAVSGLHDGELVLQDVLVRDTASRPLDGTWGRGMSLAMGVAARATRSRFERSRGLGIHAIGSDLDLTEVVISDVAPQECAETSCAQDRQGYGLGAYMDTTISMSRFLVERADTCGLLFDDVGQAVLRNGTVSMNLIGVCLQDEDLGLNSLSMGVRYVDNGRNLDSTRLPVPELGDVAPAADE